MHGNRKNEKREATTTKQAHAYKIDLTKIDGNGDFSCPKCGTKISPDDETEDTYTMLDTKVDSHGLEELVIRCNKCSSDLHLTGFSFLQKIDTAKEEREGRKKEETFYYITHV